MGTEHWGAIYLWHWIRKPDHQQELEKLEQPFAVAMQETEIPYTPEPFWQHMLDLPRFTGQSDNGHH